MTIRNTFRRLRTNRSGVAMVEFAMGAPFLLMAGLWGTETANYALVSMQVAGMATTIADNASRIGDTSSLQHRKIYESDINDLIYGAHMQNKHLKLFERGRVFISSLEVEPGTDNEYIHWQRCRGKLDVPSTYGVAGDGAGTGLDGMGPAEQRVHAQSDGAVIFVEVSYMYKPMISEKFLGRLDMHSIASFMVRDSRDLTQIYQLDPADPDQVQTCGTLRGTPEVGAGGKIT